jgi:hypothetical protein
MHRWRKKPTFAADHLCAMIRLAPARMTDSIGCVAPAVKKKLETTSREAEPMIIAAPTR